MREWPKNIGPDEIGWTVVVPGNDDPSLYDFSICRGLSVIVSTSRQDRDNGVLISLVEQAGPAVGYVLCDGECTGEIA